MTPPVIFWFRRDLRLTDNTALNAAVESGSPVIPLFILDPNLLCGERFSLRRLAFMLQGLRSLDRDLHKQGGRLHIRHGKPAEELTALIREIGATALYFNSDYSPYACQRDDILEQTLEIPAHRFSDQLIHAPDEITKGDGKPYSVFTPFRNVWETLPKTLPETTRLNGRFFNSEILQVTPIPSLADLDFRDNIELPLEAGEAPAKTRLEAFVSRSLLKYAEIRNRLIPNPFDQSATLLGSPDGTSFLSPYIRFGMISPRQLYQAAQDMYPQAAHESERHSISAWISELAWRDFYMHILYHFPHVLDRSFQPLYDRVEWLNDKDDLQRWQHGQTGFPVVDAAMRQMNTLGWMHNRARMIVSSFMTKDLLIHWREGDVYFMRQLLDGDLPANNGGWQWAAGTGTDAQPYFRVFNPFTQSRQFDPEGAYIRYWVPELRDVPNKYIHTPWDMANPPRRYTARIVDHAAARARALDAFRKVRGV
jgi:deoxyribodipyrimidine photo-lyase